MRTWFVMTNGSLHAASAPRSRCRPVRTLCGRQMTISPPGTFAQGGECAVCRNALALHEAGRLPKP